MRLDDWMRHEYDCVLEQAVRDGETLDQAHRLATEAAGNILKNADLDYGNGDVLMGVGP